VLSGPGGGRRPGAGVVLRGLVKRYGAVTAVRDVSLDIRPGEFLTFLGPSGSGKTTTLMMVAGFALPDEGSIEIDGRVVTDLDANQRGLGMVFQHYLLFPHLTVAGNVAFPLEIRKLDRATIRTRVAAALDLVQLAGLESRYPRHLSGGQQQRVALARALVYEPPVLLMDEPLGALDRKLREQMQLEIKRIQARLGLTVLYVTHDQTEALTMSDRVAVMREGRIEQVGPPDELYEFPVSRFVADFLGESNFLPGTWEAAGGAVGLRTDGGLVVRGPAAGSPPGRPGAAGLLTIRPEKVRLAPGDGPPPAPRPDEQAVPGVVGEVIYSGSVTQYRVAVEGAGTWVVEDQNRAAGRRLATGARVWVVWAAADLRGLPP
jgi:ABC-type Fe3+/spermidine/putrescine transport system ATPase subunit